MKIPDWLIQLTAETKKPPKKKAETSPKPAPKKEELDESSEETRVDTGLYKEAFNEEGYHDLLKREKEGKLDAAGQKAFGDIKKLMGVIDHVIAELTPGLKKESRPRLPPSAAKVSPSQGNKNTLPPKIKEPETSKWKEIRFNKRTGTWQVVITTRHVRNFLSENEAIDFTKKASLNKEASKASLLLGFICALTGCATTKELSRADVEQEWQTIMQRAESEIALSNYIKQMDLPESDEELNEELDVLFSGTAGEDGEVSVEEVKKEEEGADKKKGLISPFWEDYNKWNEKLPEIAPLKRKDFRRSYDYENYLQMWRRWAINNRKLPETLPDPKRGRMRKESKDDARKYCAFEKEDGKMCLKRLTKGRKTYCEEHAVWPKDDKNNE